jgi:hypothetical protein
VPTGAFVNNQNGDTNDIFKPSPLIATTALCVPACYAGASASSVDSNEDGVLSLVDKAAHENAQRHRK